MDTQHLLSTCKRMEGVGLMVSWLNHDWLCNLEEISFLMLCCFFFSLDKLHTALSELCFSINYVPNMMVWEHTFTPREYLTSHLEIRFTKWVPPAVSSKGRPPLTMDYVMVTSLFDIRLKISCYVICMFIITNESKRHLIWLFSLSRQFEGHKLKHTLPNKWMISLALVQTITSYYVTATQRTYFSAQILLLHSSRD